MFDIYQTFAIYTCWISSTPKEAQFTCWWDVWSPTRTIGTLWAEQTRRSDTDTRRTDTDTRRSHKHRHSRWGCIKASSVSQVKLALHLTLNITAHLLSFSTGFETIEINFFTSFVTVPDVTTFRNYSKILQGLTLWLPYFLNSTFEDFVWVCSKRRPCPGNFLFLLQNLRNFCYRTLKRF